MKKNLLLLSLLFSLCWSLGVQAQTPIPGDSIVYGPMLSPVYNNKVRVWVLTKNNTGSGNTLSVSLTGAGAPTTMLSGTVHNQDDRLGYSLRSFEYTNLTVGETYTAKVLVNGVPSVRTSSITNENTTIDDFEFLSGGCGRIYDLSRCIDTPESAFHVNGDPEMFNVMANEDSDLMVWLGDAVYLLGLEHAMGQCPNGVDDWANKDMAFDRYMFFRHFHDNLTMAMPQLAITDNHDTGPNEFNKTMPTLGQMKEIFMDWWPNPEYNSTPEGQGLFSSYVYKDVEYFLMDNRSYRDGTQAHLGPDQMAWLKTALLNSTATFKVLINGTPSFERNCGGRNFCNTAQSAELIAYIQANNINGVLSLSADIHEQKFMIREGDVKYPLYDVLSGNLNSDVGSGNYNINYDSGYPLTGVKQTYLRINVYGDVDDRRMKVEYVGLNGQPYFEEIIHEDMLTSLNEQALKLEMKINNNVADSSTYNHVLTATGYTLVNDRDNVANEAVHFTTATDVQMPYNNAFNMNNRPFSLVFWVKPDALPANGATIFSNATAGAGISIGINAQGKLTYTDHATSAAYASQYNILPGNWSYITYKYDNVKRKLSLYYNGFLIQNWTNVVSPSVATGNIRIGNNFQDKKFIGSIDKLALYGRLISDDFIMTEADFESNRGDVLKLNGSQAMSIPGSVVNDVLSNNFTIEFWTKLNSDPGSNYKILSSGGRVNNNTTGIGFEYPDSNKLNVIMGNNTGGWSSITEQGAAWNVGEWNHVAVSATKNGTIVYYVNGQQIASSAFGQYIPNSWGIGLGDSPAYSGDILAEMDELRIWKKSLSQQEIAQHMHYPMTGTETDLALYYNFTPDTEGGNTFSSLGSVASTITLSGASFAAATAPVGSIGTEYQTQVNGKWSKNNTFANGGLTMPDAITAYNQNIVIGKSADATTEAVPNNADLTYLKGGWRIDPMNTPFATVKINLQEALGENFATVIAQAGEYFLIKKDIDGTEFTNVTDGNFDGTNATFYNANLTDAVYYLAWSVSDFEAAGRGGALSLAGGHIVQIPYAEVNPIMDNGFTVEAWINVMQDPGNNVQLLSNHGRVNNNSTGFSLEMPDNNSISAVFGTNAQPWNSINSGTPVTIGEWNHVAVTAQPDGQIKLYINGELKASAPYVDYVPNQSWDFALGRSINYNGQTISIMDEFRLWDRVKTQEEIIAQMHTKAEGASDEHLKYSFTFDQENNGTLTNSGTAVTNIAYTNAQIIDSTSPVAEVNEGFPDKVTGNWSITNENTNGLYLTTDITSFTQNVVIARKNTNAIVPLGTATDKSYVNGGWHINSLNIATANLQVDLEKVLASPAQTNAMVDHYMLIKGDPTGTYEIVAEAEAEGLLVNFDNVTLALGNYYLAFETDINGVIAQQGGAIHLTGNHQVLIPKEGVNQALSGEFTIEMWGRLTQAAGANTKLVGFTSLTGGNFGWEMEFLGNQTLQTITGKGAAGGWNSLNSTKVWNVGEWNHAAVTFTPNGEFKFYINGELMSSMAVGTFQPCVNNLALGRNVANNSPTNSDIDEFRIWTKAKTIEEIREDMYLTMPATTTQLAYNYTFNQDDNGYLINTGSTAVEVAYTAATLIPATAPVRNIAAPFNDQVAGNWNVKNDTRNGMYLNDVLTDNDKNVVIGKEAGTEVLPITGLTEEEGVDAYYLNSRYQFNSLYIENGTPMVDLTKVFDNLNQVELIANEYFLVKGNPAAEYTIVATGTKVGNIVTFSQVAFNNDPVYLAWINDTTYPTGTFPIAKESLWKYNDTGVDLGADWKNTTYDDSTWAFGNGILGYGDNVENTTLSYGPDAANKYPTYYLRHIFNVEDASAYGSLLFNTLKDDGVVVYVNGVEAFRSNMPAGAVAYNTHATSTIGGADETAYNVIQTANLLQNGTNVIAVELHQATADSSDLGFDMEVTALPPSLPVAQYPLAKDEKWYFLDNGTDLSGTTWAATASANQGWISGNAPLGYGDPVNTIISYGPDSSAKYITSYFYRDINVNLADMSEIVDFGLKKDDGAVVYVNGVEVFRDNMPTGAVTNATTATAAIDGADENRYVIHQVAKTAFVAGTNRIAVELHQANASSSDLKFDLYLKNSVYTEVSCEEPHISCFTSINPTVQTTNLLIPQEHRFQLLFKEGTAYTAPFGNITTVPGNHDFTAYLAINGSSETGHLSVNHENAPGGVSMLNIHLDNNELLWNVDTSTPVDLYNQHLITTTRNCSGGITPWGTVVTAEENTAVADVNGDGYYDEGWLVEIDPATAMVKEHGNGFQEKLWAMGRMNHENVVVTNDGTKAYYGEDGGTHCVYKFVPTVPNNLYSGKVYVLKLDLPLADDEPSSSTATWVEVPNTTQADRNNLRDVAGNLGGTNFNGVEDCDINPVDGKVYFTSKGKNRIYRFKDNGDTISEFEVFIGGMSYPLETASGTVMEEWRDGNDNIAFDDKGNLWLCQDGGRNYIWVVRPDHTQTNPNVKLFASMPAGAEPTGLTFTPDHKYGFFSVQHPNSTNVPQMDATFGEVNFNASASVVFALQENLGLQAPVADFVADDVTVTPGQTVTFTDLSTHTPTAWQWTFEGGTPATSTAASPTVTFAEAGSYDVSLVTTNAAGTSQTVSKPEYIVVEIPAGLGEHQLANTSIYPNPTKGKVTIELNEEAGQKVTIEVYDLLGRKVSNTETVTAGGNQKIDLNVTALVGEQVFFIQLKVGEKTGSYKLLKTN